MRNEDLICSDRAQAPATARGWYYHWGPQAWIDMWMSNTMLVKRAMPIVTHTFLPILRLAGDKAQVDRDYQAIRARREVVRWSDSRYGALWASYFPGLTLEWYPNVLVVSHLIPRSPQLTTNVVEFYYPEEIALFEREFVEAQQAAYNETAAEDGELCARMERGRRALYQQGLDDAGPYQSPLEDAMVHFHEWVRKKIQD